MRVTLIAGMAQQGKTSLALHVARREARRLIMLDPTRARVAAHLSGVNTWRSLAKWLATPGASSQQWALALRSKDPADYAAVLRHAEYFRHVTLLVDEALTFTTDAEAMPWLVRAARTSAHYGGGIGVPLILTAQRPVDVPRDVRSQLTRLMVFQTREPGDLEWIAKFTQDPELAERVAGLAPHTWMEYPAPTHTGGKHDESVPLGRARGGGVARRVSDGPEAQPDPQAPRRIQVGG